MAKHTFTYCYEFYGSVDVEADNRDEADRLFDEIDFDKLRECEDGWCLTLVQETDDNGNTHDYVM